MISGVRAALRARQRGAISIEFVLLFPLFLAVFYATLSYGVSFAQLHVLNGMASEATRSARAVVMDEDGSESAISSRINGVIGRYGGLLNVTGCFEDGKTYDDEDIEEGLLTVCLQTELLLPSLTIFGIQIPDIASPLESRSSIRLAVPDNEE